MIWTLRVKVYQMQPECVRLIEIDSDDSFLELHEAIQAAVDFGNDHLFEFFIGRNPRNRAFPVGGERNWDTFDPFETYSRVPLIDVWPIPKGMKLFYHFDFGDDWLFQVTKTQHKNKTPEPGITYPRVIEIKGENPEQYPMWEEE